ncbi:MAG: hypothetical protein WC782_13505 [Methylococcaceae bacterium]|jgi:hypothetical protein
MDNSPHWEKIPTTNKNKQQTITPLIPAKPPKTNSPTLSKAIY